MEDESTSDPQALGKVTEDLDVPRGPDLSMEITVPASWIAEGATLVVAWPRRLLCRACGGGGCDACGRSGAFSLQGEPVREPFEVSLPRREAPPSSLTIRLPSLGMPSDKEDHPPGHLFLEVRPGQPPSAGVARATRNESRVLRRDLMRSSVWMAIFVSLLFLGMLRLSGWL
ncbi:MAG: hypothetical protein B6A08_13550 [Sorangiineae bacterium NIC37A_2]|jgi:hypothetical protein|nr:MAG: hypothetical protein B6A08_13550 [Sorangiineae bacterium NIC37A_2]